MPAVLGDCLDRCHVVRSSRTEHLLASVHAHQQLHVQVQCHNSQGYLDSLELIRTKCQHLQVLPVLVHS